MSSLRRLEGYQLIDNRAAGEGVSETAVATCHHCQRVCILHPARTVPLDYCPRCDHYICRACAERRRQTLECVPFKQVLEERREALFQAEQASRGVILVTGE